jgi:hypothetical protein
VPAARGVRARIAQLSSDGNETETGPGDVLVIPPGHDAWVVADESVIAIDWSGAAKYAKG